MAVGSGANPMAINWGFDDAGSNFGAGGFLVWAGSPSASGMRFLHDDNGIVIYDASEGVGLAGRITAITDTDFTIAWSTQKAGVEIAALVQATTNRASNVYTNNAGRTLTHGIGSTPETIVALTNLSYAYNGQALNTGHWTDVSFTQGFGDVVANQHSVGGGFRNQFSGTKSWGSNASIGYNERGYNTATATFNLEVVDANSIRTGVALDTGGYFALWGANGANASFRNNSGNGNQAINVGFAPDAARVAWSDCKNAAPGTDTTDVIAGGRAFAANGKQLGMRWQVDTTGNTATAELFTSGDSLRLQQGNQSAVASGNLTLTGTGLNVDWSASTGTQFTMVYSLFEA